jgi:DNA-binding beta-propeller fold protein YncE
MLSLIAVLVPTLVQLSSPSVVFVCAHGAAKSLIAATYFNKLAEERGMPYRATFRGVTPDDDLSARALEGLKGDGLSPPSDKPQAISESDIRTATHIFAIGCPLPEQARRSGRADEWSDVPDDRGYGPMRDAIVAHVKALLDRLAVPGAPRPPLRQIAAIPLPGVKGRIDHLAFDAARQRLFVAALGNDTVEVLDTATLTHLESLTGFHEPQGIAAVPDLGAMAVANGTSGTLQLVDAQTYATRWTIPIGGDADNVRYDAAAKRLWVAAEGGLYAVDPSAGRTVGRIAIDGHPESFQLGASETRVFANLPGASHSQVIAGDRSSMKTTAHWTTHGCGGNYPMALDERTSRLLIGCRRPATLALLDTRGGSLVASAGIVGDTDDLFDDAARRRVYVIGGEGFVDVLARDGDRLTRIGRTSTRAGARTGLWVPSQGRLYVAVPLRGGDAAEVRVFEVDPGRADAAASASGPADHDAGSFTAGSDMRLTPDVTRRPLGGRRPDVGPIHARERTAIGSRRVARRAGTMLAVRAAPATSIAVPSRASGSVGPTPVRNARSTVAPSVPVASPIARPAPIGTA